MRRPWPAGDTGSRCAANTDPHWEQISYRAQHAVPLRQPNRPSSNMCFSVRSLCSANGKQRPVVCLSKSAKPHPFSRGKLGLSADTFGKELATGEVAMFFRPARKSSNPSFLSHVDLNFEICQCGFHIRFTFKVKIKQSTVFINGM